MSNFSKIQVINGQDIVINKKVMNTEQTVEQLNDSIIVNYQEQVEILRSINETNNQIIESQNRYIGKLEEYIQNMKSQLEVIQTILKA